MILSFSPQRRNAPLLLERLGDALIVNGETVDFAPLLAGYILPPGAIPSDLFPDPVRRDLSGVLHITLVLPHGPHAPEAARFPAQIVDPPDGPVALPSFGPRAE